MTGILNPEQSIADDADTVDATAVQEALRTQGERIAQQEAEQALTRLEAHGTLTPAQREIVEELAMAICTEILSSPVSALDTTDEYDAETIRTAIELFDPDG